MKAKTSELVSFWEKTIILERETITSDLLKINYRKSEKYFTRDRKLTFENMIILMLLKWVKSIQLRLNEFSEKLPYNIDPASVSAYVQAKNKISYEVFVNMSLNTIINRYYDREENKAWYELWKSFRLIATDGSQIRLPDEQEIIQRYWETQIKNGQWDQWKYSHGLLSVLYDPLNNLAIDSLLEGWNYSERALAIQNVLNLEKTKQIKEKDLMLYDRWYYSSFLFGILLAYEKEFLCRVKTKTCKAADELFEADCGIDSKIITLNVENKSEDYKKKYGINLEREIAKTITIRLVRLVLDTGEVEVLATSLLDEQKYTVEMFRDLYFQRWWIEVYYDVLKNRLWLENFTWKSVESVLQDLHSSIYISNLETILTRESNEELKQKSKKKKLKNEQKVNKQVSFNIIKNKIIELFLSDDDASDIMQEMIQVFRTNPTQLRKWRTNPRKKPTASKSLHHNKRKKKHCF